ncbi:class I SAM-dependent methyltransferase [Amycolatopsis tucumanensis]|uniref:Methyltransferase domain-containing protein n=1 Tax=Amycolatopsis tucumanensis TaxID=401106 RepID=A0ABP7J246_9PSEU|nr:class I SAM-dependent methyltransferase [Amycolatopsis tucumanensis]MCF6422212.1 methyltransferase domain-containing protein [Amycolatopsis tucumanensis]
MTRAHAQHQSHDHHGHDHHDADSAQAEILELDAEALAEHTTGIIRWLPLHGSPRQIVDLAAGTGAGTFALLDQFPEAHVTAVDTSPGHLRRLSEKACARGVDGHVRTVLADLDEATWPDLGTPDLVWASGSVHHLADPGRALRAVHDLLAPGGLFVVVEMAGLPRFLPTTAPADRPGLEDRVHAAGDRLHARHLPHRGADWGPMLAAAGFVVEGELHVDVNVEGAGNPVVGRYALHALQRVRGAVAAELDREDLAALDRLLDVDGPHSLLRRDDLAVRTKRSVWAARRA